VRVTPHGLEKVAGIFISRLVPGGLAESTGLLAVNDEVLEVNGIEVVGKSLDQVTGMMVANSANLIITVKPVNQRNTLSTTKRGAGARASGKSHTSTQSGHSQASNPPSSCDSDDVRDFPHDDDEDEVKEHLGQGEGSRSGSEARSTGGASGDSGGNTGGAAGASVEDDQEDTVVTL